MDGEGSEGARHRAAVSLFWHGFALLLGDIDTWRQNVRQLLVRVEAAKPWRLSQCAPPITPSSQLVSDLQQIQIPICGADGCKDNACLCRGSTLGDEIPKLSSAALKMCSNYDDASTAVSILTAYCSDKGYTETVTPVVGLTTGASTATTVTAVATVTAFATVTALETQIRFVSTAAPMSTSDIRKALEILGLVTFTRVVLLGDWSNGLRRYYL